MEAKIVAENNDYQLISVPKDEWEMFQEFMALSPFEWLNRQANHMVALNTVDIEEILKDAGYEDVPFETLLEIVRHFSSKYSILEDVGVHYLIIDYYKDTDDFKQR